MRWGMGGGWEHGKKEEMGQLVRQLSVNPSVSGLVPGGVIEQDTLPLVVCCVNNL